MALNLDPASIAEALRKNVESWSPSIEREEVGRVIESGDGIARVSGLPQAMANELLEFPGELLGLAFNLDEDEIGCIVLGDASSIEEGDAIMLALGRLPASQRQALVLKYLDGLSVEEIAAVLGLPVGTVRSRLHRARAQFRAALEREEALDG